MNHENDIAIIDELLDDAILLHKYLPILLSLGVDTLLRRISKSDMSKIGHLLKDRTDRRHGQILFQYELGRLIRIFCLIV